MRTVACASGQAAACLAPSARGRTGATWPASVMWGANAASASGDSRTASRRRSREPGGGAPCAQRRGSRGARSARVGRVVRRICRSASAERALPPGRPRAERSTRRVRSTRAPTGRELAWGKLGLYRSQILQVNTRWKALAEIYIMHSFAPFSNLSPVKRLGIIFLLICWC